MAYVPPIGDDVQFNFTDTGYHAPLYGGQDFDFDNNLYRAENPIITNMPGTWDMNPVDVGPLRPIFKCTFREFFNSGESGAGEAITDVEVNVWDVDGNAMWRSGVLNFRAFIDADHPDRPFLNYYGYDGESVTVLYGLDLVWPMDPTAVHLIRDNTLYHWEMHFYINDLGIFTSFGRGTFQMFNEYWQPIDLTTEGMINPIDVTPVHPELQATYSANYLPSVYIPKAEGYVVEVSRNIGFTDIIWTSSGTLPSLYPGDTTPVITYNGPSISRDGNQYFWRIVFLIDVEWSAMHEYSPMSDINNWIMLLEYFNLIDPRVNYLDAPLNLKDFHPKFNATFSDNYSAARAVKVQVQVKYHTDTWSIIKWDSDLVGITPVVPGTESQQVQYPDPYPSGDEGLYFDGLDFDYRMRFEVDSDGTYYTDWAELSSISNFKMGIAIINSIDLMIDGKDNTPPLTPRILSFLPNFTATYSTDDTRALAVKEQIQVSNDEAMTDLVWDSGELAISTSVLNGESPPPVTISSVLPYLLKKDTHYYWRIRLSNERSILGSWNSPVSTFLSVGWIISKISQNDAISIIRSGKEYEARVESKDDYIYFWLNNIVDPSDPFNISDYPLNVGRLPRILYDQTGDTFTLVWMMNSKMFKRSWGFTESPESASTVAPQLLDCTYYPLSINTGNGYNDYAYSHCPYKVTNIVMRDGQSLRWGTDWSVGVLVTWTPAANHTLYDNTMYNGVLKKHYDIYVDRIREGVSLPVDTVIDYIPEIVIPSTGGVEVVTKQEFIYHKNSPCQDLEVSSDYARGTYYPGEAISILDGTGPGVLSGQNSMLSDSKGGSYCTTNYFNIPLKIVERILDEDSYIGDSSSHSHGSYNVAVYSNIPLKIVERVLDEDSYIGDSSSHSYGSHSTATYYTGGYIR